MTDNIDRDAAARRDAARVSGRFGPQNNSDPEIVIYRVGDVDQEVRDALECKSNALASAVPKSDDPATAGRV